MFGDLLFLVSVSVLIASLINSHIANKRSTEPGCLGVSLATGAIIILTLQHDKVWTVKGFAQGVGLYSNEPYAPRPFFDEMSTNQRIEQQASYQATYLREQEAERQRREQVRLQQCHIAKQEMAVIPNEFELYWQEMPIRITACGGAKVLERLTHEKQPFEKDESLEKSMENVVACILATCLAETVLQKEKNACQIVEERLQLATKRREELTTTMRDLRC